MTANDNFNNEKMILQQQTEKSTPPTPHSPHQISISSSTSLIPDHVSIEMAASASAAAADPRTTTITKSINIASIDHHHENNNSDDDNNNNNNNNNNTELPKSLVQSLLRLKIDPILNLGDIEFLTSQACQILVPATLCSTLGSILFKLGDIADGDGTNNDNNIPSSGNKDDTITSAHEFKWYWAFAIIGFVIFYTIIMMVLFIYNCRRTLYGLFGFSGILSILCSVFFFSRHAAKAFGFGGGEDDDYIFLSFFVAIFCVVYYIYAAASLGGTGLAMRCLLGFVSSIYGMRFGLIGTDAICCLLALLVIWDLAAVLLPFGPLQVLVKSAQKHNINVDALLYKVEDGPLEELDEDKINLKSPVLEEEDKDKDEIIITTVLEEEIEIVEQQDDSNVKNSNETIVEEDDDDDDNNNNNKEKKSDGDGGIFMGRRNGIRLGLGDLVFYTTLCTVAIRDTWSTFILCVIVTISGLTTTIVLLAVLERMLPALPISLSAGIAIYYIGKFSITPFLKFTTDNNIFF